MKMKKSLCIAICFAVVISACAIGFSVFAGADNLEVVSGPTKMYYLDKKDAIDVTGTKLSVKIDGVKQELLLDKNIEKSGSLAEANTTTTTEATTIPETTTANAESTTAPTTAAPEIADVNKVKVYYDELKNGQNEIIFKYEDKTASTYVYLDADPVKSIVVTKVPDKVDYNYGYDTLSDFNFAGLEIDVTYKNFGDGEKTMHYAYNDNNSLKFMGYLFSIKAANERPIEGRNFITVTYLGKESSFGINLNMVLIGDANGDGAVNAADLVRLARIANKQVTDYDILECNIDDKDGKGIVNNQDVLALRDMLTKADTTGEYEWIFDAKLLSYRVSPDGYFYTDDDPWQRNFGFNALYDYATPYTFMYYDTFRVFFEYGTYKEGELDGVPAGTPKQWMIQPWKGQYGMVLYGSELGVYTKPDTRETPHYDCANNADRLPMSMTVYKDEKEAFSMPYKEHWWITGFKPGALTNYTDMTKPHSQLTIKFAIDFPTSDMANLFAAGLAERGFTKAGFIDTVSFRKVDVYTINGNRVEFLWRNVVGTPGQTNVPNVD
ncbi:MAG: DUF4474 domain-containing protein [Ruminococcaceae bacterium]|nr:DUF4474 domain-containing protein [Oscillospiraceae bacterium]